MLIFQHAKKLREKFNSLIEKIDVKSDKKLNSKLEVEVHRLEVETEEKLKEGDNTIEIKSDKFKLNYSLDIELQKERGNREQMQAKLRLHSSGPKRMPQLQQRSTPDRDS